MRLLPNRSELLALISVWLIYPALVGLAWAMTPGVHGFSGTLPFLARLGIECGQLVERCIPSTVGTGLLVAIARFVKSDANRSFLCHLLTFAAFGFTVAVMVLVASAFNALSGR